MVRLGALVTAVMLAVMVVVEARPGEGLSALLLSLPWLATLVGIQLVAQRPSPRRLRGLRRCAQVIGVLHLVGTAVLMMYTPAFVVLALLAVIPLTAMAGATERGAALLAGYAGVLSLLVSLPWGAVAVIAPLLLAIGGVGWMRETRGLRQAPSLPIATAHT